MQIKDLEARQGNVDIVVEVTDIGEVREFSKFGRTSTVATAKAKDESGEIQLSLWNEQIDTVKVGDKVHLTNAYVSEFNGELQLTTGKFGKLEVVSSVKTETQEQIVETPLEEAQVDKEDIVM